MSILLTFNQTFFETKHIQINIYIYINSLTLHKHNMLLYCFVGKIFKNNIIYIYVNSHDISDDVMNNNYFNSLDQSSSLHKILYYSEQLFRDTFRNNINLSMLAI